MIRPLPLIATLTPNPALDRTLVLDGPTVPGRLHRIREVRETAGGKGLNAARAVQRLGGRVVAAVPLGGEHGRTFAARAAEEGIELLVAPAEGEIRCCTIVVQDEPPYPTEFNERSARVEDQAWSTLVAAIDERGPEWLAISGNPPAGTSADVLLDAVQARLPAQRWLVDSEGVLTLAALRRGARLISPNRAELLQLSRMLGWTEEGHEAARRVHREFGAEVLLSDGEWGAAWYGQLCVAARPTPVQGGNPVGCGDTLLGALVAWVAAEGGWPVGAEARMAALRYAVAAATANVVVGGGARISPEGVLEQLEGTVAWAEEP